MNDLQKARTRAHAHGVIANGMAQNTHYNWESFHRRKQKQANDQARKLERMAFIDGEFEIAG